jgi:predicted nucleic acid-binding protein
MKQEPVFLDTDVILDLLLERDPYFEPALNLFVKIQNQQVSAFTSPIVIANLYYILSRHLGRKAAAQSLMKLKILVTVIDCDKRVVVQALSRVKNRIGTIHT